MSTIYHLLLTVKPLRLQTTLKSSDSLQFQQNLFAWSVKWQLKFNVSKCFIFHLGPEHSYGDYYLDGV